MTDTPRVRPQETGTGVGTEETVSEDRYCDWWSGTVVPGQGGTESRRG